MKILVDIGHPAHVHFYKNPIRIWRRLGCAVVVTSRRKEMATDLLDALDVAHHPISTMNRGGPGGMAAELIERDRRLYGIARKEKPDILTGIGGIFVAHVGRLTHTPSVVFYDTENARLSNLITYPFCSLVVVPRCYRGWLPPWHLKYPGYHELSYLHPKYFRADKSEAVGLGLDPGRRNFFIRTVSWQASHDLNEQKWSPDLLRKIVQELSAQGKVFVSSERPLPADLAPYAYQGPPDRVHHLLGHVDLFVGESATMASECAVMGVPAVYLAQTGRGYTDEQQRRYRLVYNLQDFHWEKIEPVLADIQATPRSIWKKRRERLLADTVDVAAFAADLIMGYPNFPAGLRRGGE